MPTSIALHDLLRSRLDVFTRLLHRVEDGDVRSVHRTRVATRRLRELLPILQLEAATSRKLGRRLRLITRRLGRLRELDVLLIVIDELHASGSFPAVGLGRIAADIRRARGEAREALADTSLTPELRRVARKLDALVDDLKSADARRTRGRGWRWAIDARVSRRAATLTAAMDVASALYLPERLHVVRIALKKLRYAAELASDAAGIAKSADLQALKRYQDLLGRLHDLQVLIERVRRAQASLDPPDLRVWRELDTLIIAIEQRCRRLHARYVRERPAIAAICGRTTARAARLDRRSLGGRGQTDVRRAG